MPIPPLGKDNLCMRSRIIVVINLPWSPQLFISLVLCDKDHFTHILLVKTFVKFQIEAMRTEARVATPVHFSIGVGNNFKPGNE